MNTFWRQTWQNLWRTLVSVRTLVLFFCALIAHALPIYLEVSNSPFMNKDIAYYHYMFFGHERIIHIVIGAILIATLFPDDWNYGISKYASVRSDKYTYAAAKAAGAWISNFIFQLITAACSLLLLISIAKLIGKDTGYDTIASLLTYPNSIGALINTSATLYYLTSIILFAVKISFWNSIAFFVSVVNANVFLTVASPLLIYYLGINLLGNVGFGGIFNLTHIGTNNFSFGSTAYSILYSILFFAILALAFLILSYRLIIRRFEHD